MDYFGESLDDHILPASTIRQRGVVHEEGMHEAETNEWLESLNRDTGGTIPC